MWQFRPCKAVWSTQKQLLRKARLMCWNDYGFFLSMVMWAIPGPSKMAFIGSCNLRQRSLEQFEEAQLDALNARNPMFTKQWYDMDILRHLQLNWWGRNQYQCTKQKLAFHFCAKELHARVTDTPFCAALWEELGRPNKSLGILNGWFRWLMVWSHTVTWDFVMCNHFFWVQPALARPGDKQWTDQAAARSWWSETSNKVWVLEEHERCGFVIGPKDIKMTWNM